MATGSRSRVYQDRLWDADGREWRGQLGSLASTDDVTRLLAAHAPVVVHGFGRQFRTLNTRQAEAFWAHARQHFLAPGHSDVAPDQDGLTYAAQVWSHSGEQLLGFVEYC